MALFQLVLIVLPNLILIFLINIFIGAAFAIGAPYVKAESIFLFIPFVALICGIAPYVGSIYLRFGVRLFPVRSDCRLDTFPTIILVSIVIIFTTCYMYFGWEFFPVVFSYFTIIPQGKGLDAAVIPHLVASLEAFVVQGILLFAWILFSVIIPSIILLLRHLNPRWWSTRPYLLFLRRFSSATDAFAISPLIHGVPRGVNVVFLEGPRTNRKIWSPYILGISSFVFTRPFSGIPICLRSTDQSWEADVESLVKNAICLVIDTSEDSLSIRREEKIVQKLSIYDRVIRLYNNNQKIQTQNTTQFLPKQSGHSIEYNLTWKITVIISIFLFIIAAASFGNILIIFRAHVLELDQNVDQYLWIVSTVVAALFVKSYTWHPHLDSISKKQIRNKVKEIILVNIKS